jgi:hypothetical protein
MKILYFIAFLIGMSLLPLSVLSQPIIHSIDFSPSDKIWVGEPLTVQINCSDQNQTIVAVYATIIGRDGYTIPNKTFSLQNGLYTGTIDPVYLNNENEFLFNISCVNDISETTFSTRNFTVSNFTSDIVSIHPSSIYLNDKIEIDVSVRKNNIPIAPPENVSFLITLNDEPKIPSSIPYDPVKGWIIYLDSPASTGSYNLKLTTIYDRVNTTSISTINVNEPIQFSMTNIDKTWVKNNDTITMQIQAFDRGSKISLNSNNLAVQIGSTYATIVSITPTSNYYTVSVLAPSQSGGSYPITAMLSYNGYTYTASNTIYYTTLISGKILDADGNGVSTEIRFYSGDILKLRIYTDANGAYSGYIPPGTYDVEAIFPDATLYLYDVDASSFSDSIRHYSLPSVDVPGLNIAGLHVFEVASTFSRAYIEMRYDESKVDNENLLDVYKCEDWSTGKRICNGYWEEIAFTPDTVRNIMSVNTTSFSAYAIGNVKTLSIDYTLDKGQYNLNDPMKLRGQTVDEYKNPVPNATVRVYIRGTGINFQTKSDNNGLFNFEFISPGTEGVYTLFLSAEENPYMNFNTTKTIELVRSKDISIVFPDTLKIKEGENLNQELRIVNIGQSDLYGLNISLTGVPDQYYTIIGPVIEKLASGETKTISIAFNIPSNASLGTSSATLNVSNSGVSKEKIFGFTILSSNQTQIENVNNTITGWFSKVSMPKIDLRIVYVTIFAVICFSLAFVLKKRKGKNEKRGDIKNFLSDVKNHINKKEPSYESAAMEETTDHSTDDSYRQPDDNSSDREVGM